MKKLISGILLASIILSMLAVLPTTVQAATPTTTLTISDGPDYGSSPTYINSNTKFTLSSSETGSTWFWWESATDTYDAEEYSTPFGPAVEIKTPGAPVFPIDLEGLNTLYYNSSDDAATVNHETTKSLQVYVDDFGPSTTIDFANSVVNGGTTYLNTTSEISFSSSDIGSGLKDIYYKIDQSSWAIYTEPGTIYTSGSHTIYYYAEDNLGNKEAEQSAIVIVDTVGPDVQIIPGEPSTDEYISASTQITIEATDRASGVSIIYYKADQDFWQTYTTPISFSTEGPHMIRAYAVDRIGHPSDVILIGWDVDNTPPEVSVTGAVNDAIKVDVGDSLFFVTSDSGASNCTIQYSLDGGLNWALYNGITVEENMVITYYSLDAMGNYGEEHTLTVTVNSSNNMLYLGIGFTIAAVGIIFLIYINRPRTDSPKKKSKEEPEEEPKTEKKKSKKRN